MSNTVYKTNENGHPQIRFGVIGAGYMGKRHAVALQSVGAVFGTHLRPICEVICTRSEQSATAAQHALGFRRSTTDWRQLVNDPDVDAVVIASPQTTHKEIALEAIKASKPVFCEKPLGASLEDARTLAKAAKDASAITMVGFNYIRTPASQQAHQLITDGVIGDLTWIRAEHTEDFLADPNAPATWRTQGGANGTLGDLAPHIINAVLRLVGPIKEVCADVETVHSSRPGAAGTEAVTNDDQAHFLCRFERGVMGHVHVSRVSAGRKMGYAYDIVGTKGAIRFDQEDQNALWLYQLHEPQGVSGFRKILTNGAHPDYQAFCEGPGHGTGYQDQITIEARDFLTAIERGHSVWPSFDDGLEVSQVVEACRQSAASRRWVSMDSVA